MMWAVVDTPVWVQGFGCPGSPPREVVNRFLRGEFFAVASGPLLEELSEVLSLPRFAAIFPDAVGLASLAALSMGYVAPHLTRVVPGDEWANPAVQAASAAQADCIVTGDKALLDVATFETTKVVTAERFLEILEAEMAQV